MSDNSGVIKKEYGGITVDEAVLIYEHIQILYFLIAAFACYKLYKKFCDRPRGWNEISRIYPNPDVSNSQCILPMYTVSNNLENENSETNNGLNGPPHQSLGAARTSRINDSTPEATNVPLNSDLNYMTENPPPSYDQSTDDCPPTALPIQNLPEN